MKQSDEQQAFQMGLTRHAIVVGLAILLSVSLSGCGSDTAASSTNSSDGSSQDNTTPPPSENHPPVASIAGEHNYLSGETVTLDGSGSSDPDNDSLQFLWSQTQGPGITLSGTANSTLSFVAPTVSQPTQFTFRLSVQDGALSDSTDHRLQISPLSDTTPPSVSARHPEPDQAGVPVTVQVSVSFNEALLVTSVDASSLRLTQGGTSVAGSVDYDDASRSIHFTPDSPLAEAATYQVTLGDGVQDTAGNFASAESWSFTTASGYNLGPTSQQTIDQCMDQDDMEMLTLVNNARASTRNCGTTSYPAAAPLAWNCLLENAATGHSASMAQNDFFSHTGLDGSSPGDRITAAGYVWRTYGENIAAGYGDAQAAMAGWLSSAGHCANLMSARFTEMGAGMASDSASAYGLYWTQDFASP
jgi:uncharacterized protein YkwD